MSTARASLAVLVFFASCLACCTAESTSPVVELDDFTFVSQVQGTPNVWLVEFVQEDCQACAAFSPSYHTLAQSLKGIVKVGLVHCQKTPGICSKERVETLPFFKAYSWDVKKNPYTHKLYKEDGQFYTGRLSSKDLSTFATGLLPSDLVTNVTGDSLNQFLDSNATLPKVMLISAKQSVTPLYKALSLRFRGAAIFGQARSTDDAVVDKFKASSFPSIFLVKAVPGGDDEPIRYQGQTNAEDVASFLKQFVPEAEGGTPGTSAEGEGEGSGSESSQGWGWIRHLDALKFKEDVIKNEELYLVALVDSSAEESCPKEVEQWHELGQQLSGLVFTGEFNLTTEDQRTSLASVYTLPVRLPQSCINFLLFPFGDDKEDSDPVVLPGDSDFKALQQAVYDTSPTTFVVQLTSDNLQMFAYSDMSIPKFVLFSAKAEVPGPFRVISTNFRKDNRFGFAHESETELVEQFKVVKFPHLVVLFPTQDPRDKSKVSLSVMPYQGSLKLKALVDFVVQMSASVREAFGDRIEIPKVEDDDQFSLHCVERKRLCVIGLFKGDALVPELSRVASKWKTGDQFSFLWVDVSSSSSSSSSSSFSPEALGFARQLEVSASAIPTAVVLSPTKLRLAVLPETFSHEAATSFLDGLLLGKVRTFEIQSLPSFSASPTLGADELETHAAETQGSAEGASVGLEQPEEPVEEEFDLADILSEHVEDEDSLTKEHKLQEVERELEEKERLTKEASKKKTKKKKKKTTKGAKGKQAPEGIKEEL